MPRAIQPVRGGRAAPRLGREHWPMAAATAILAVAAAGGLWMASGTSASTDLAAAPPSPLARAFKKDQPRRIAAPSRVPTEIAFIDSPAAGRREYDGGDLDAALEHFRDAIEKNPGDAEARSNAGQVLIRLGRTAEALPLLQEAAEMDPGRWAYRFNVGRAEGLLGHWDKAAEDYGQAARLFPGDYATLFNLGQALHRAGKEEEAVAHYRLAIEQQPADASFYLALGISEEKLGHSSQAAAAYRRFIEMDPLSRQAEAVKARAAQLEAKNGQAGGAQG